MSVRVAIKLGGRRLRPHKAILNPLLGSKTVLTNSPWEFVSLWLKKERLSEAQFYWDQAREFHQAAENLPTRSAPLLHYYTFLNATKALLTAKKVTFDKFHGISGYSAPGARHVSINNAGVKIKNAGVLPSLSTYLGETEAAKKHSLKELFFNLPYIHRTYCLTFPNQVELFVPIKSCEYVVDTTAKRARFRATLSEDFASLHVLKRLPPEFTLDSRSADEMLIRSVEEVPFFRPSTPTTADLQNLVGLHRKLRLNLVYINGTQTLWYIRAIAAGPKTLARYSPVITLAAMHRLSELCRYQPLEFESLLSGQKNWLLSEFIQQAPKQFLDEIAAEITGHQFLVPNVRVPN